MDWQLIQPIFHWLSEHPVWSGLFVFLIALTESLVIVGLVVPGTVLMFGVGTLVGTGVLDVKLVLFLAFIGAVIGDGISFWFGATYREQISDFWPFKNNPQILEKGKAFFARHGGKSVFFGRFVGPVRPVIPAVAGMMHMPAKTFFTINIISAAGWAPFYLVPGILFGSSIGLASAIGSRLVILLLGIFFGAILLVYLLKKSMKYTMPKLEGWFKGAIQWSSRHAVFGKIVVALVDPDKDTKKVLVNSIFLLIFLVLFFTTFILSLWSSWLLNVDAVVKNIFGLLRTAPADELMWVIQLGFSWLVLLLAILNVFAGLYFSGLNKALNYFLTLLVVTALSSVFVVFVHGLSIIEVLDAISFAHFSLLVSAVLFYAVISCESVAMQYRWSYYAIAILIIFAVAFSELYFSLLLFSQVLVGISLSAAWVLIFSLAYRRHAHIVKSMGLVSVSTIVLIALVVILMISNNANREVLMFAHKENQVVSTSEWLDGSWRNLPGYRADVFGKKKNSLNLQWMGSLEEIKSSLSAAGWQPSKKVTFRSILYWLAPNPELNNIIRLPQTNEGRTESVLYLKTEANRQLVLQLWPTLIVNDKGQPLWLGAISLQRLVSGERWLSFFRVEKSAASILINDHVMSGKWQMRLDKRIDEKTKEGLSEVLLIFK